MVIFGAVLRVWLRWKPSSSEQRVRLVAVTILGTFIVSWHSHFYMQMLVVPLLLYLDVHGTLAPGTRAAWLFGPPAIYAAVHLISPALESRLFGTGMLVLNTWMLLRIGRNLKPSEDPRVANG
jgi:hypothetical protein